VTEQLDESRTIRSAGIVISLLIAAIALGIGTAQARKKKAEGPPADLAGHVAYLGKQLPGQDVEDAEPVTNEIQKLVVDHLNTWIAHRSPNIIQVRQELEQVFSKLQYPAAATPSAFRAPWKGTELIGAGYTLGWSDIWRVSVIVLYENRNGQTQEITTAQFVPRADLHYAILPPSGAGDFRFLAYGWKLGMSHPRLTAFLYTFDGKKLQSQWKTEDRFGGKLTVNNNELVIRYLNENEYIRETQQGHLPPRHEITYKITPQGLQLEGEHDIPYQ
jgi:hypothetical protein